ncbi:MAG: ATP-binding protein [Saprospiraceae bacterium]|jgi:two-component system, OmpR family, phosphate regulon sensor histidine kinase PhoR|nr:ATP-binding protein [Saprospiraceae bacterium]MDP4699422.1 ATP-binding protein [Saprospiraceae bacterium]MDP4813717.1 ATP-binding protein [Saprospiraceae bacterium]MDP5049861.1 ATP-binding protein [Saprospiraceae bacterium]MDP5090082.1 ATP-binding protein [Saprospiraceae bacterium]
MLKNPTPHQISIRSSLLTSLGVTLLVFIYFQYFSIPLKPLYYLYFVTIVFVINYFVFKHYISVYVQRKIKLIYKTIRVEKLQPVEKKKQINTFRNVLEEVETEVAAWVEEQKQEMEKQKIWAEYRRNFMGDVSHELKTPIFNIQGYIETLLDGAVDEPHINRHFLQKASKNVDRLQTIINDLETISRLESGDSMLELRIFDIKKLVEEVFEELEIKAAARNVALIFKEGAQQGFKVKADREKVHQVLINLVHNAIKYGKNNGYIKLSFYDMERQILIEVADNGAGISKEHLPHLFDRFYRVEKSRSRNAGGTGLGLAIVKHIIEAHQQTIHVRSSVEMGSTFGFTLEKA